MLKRIDWEDAPPAHTLPPDGMSVADMLLQVTKTSEHSYEQAVHRLVTELSNARARGQIQPNEHAIILTTAMEVLSFFHYEPGSLEAEVNLWYRASILHQVGQGMVQALALLRPDLVTRPFFSEAASSLCIHRATAGGIAVPLSCKQWAGAVCL